MEKKEKISPFNYRYRCVLICIIVSHGINEASGSMRDHLTTHPDQFFHTEQIQNGASLLDNIVVQSALTLACANVAYHLFTHYLISWTSRKEEDGIDKEIKQHLRIEGHKTLNSVMLTNDARSVVHPLINKKYTEGWKRYLIKTGTMIALITLITIGVSHSINYHYTDTSSASKEMERMNLIITNSVEALIGLIPENEKEKPQTMVSPSWDIVGIFKKK